MQKLLFKVLDLTGPVWGGILNHIVLPLLKRIQTQQELKAIDIIKRKDEESVQNIERILAAKPKSKVDKTKKDKELRKNLDNILGG